MLARAPAGVAHAGLDGRVIIQQADILALPYPDGTFDRVLAEAVTMFADRRTLLALIGSDPAQTHEAAQALILKRP